MLHVFGGGVLIQKFSLKAGLNRLGKEVKANVIKELYQNHGMQTYLPLDPKTINTKQCD